MSYFYANIDRWVLKQKVTQEVGKEIRGSKINQISSDLRISTWRKLLYTNIDQKLVNSLHGLSNCEIGGLDCRVITTDSTPVPWFSPMNIKRKQTVYYLYVSIWLLPQTWGRALGPCLLLLQSA